MYCNWKTLIMFGFIFWVISYVTDLFYADPRSKVISEEDKMVFFMNEPPIIESPLHEDSNLFVILWSISTFLVTIGSCFLFKYFNSLVLQKFLRKQELKQSKSRIPIATHFVADSRTAKFSDTFTNTNSVETENQSTNTHDLSAKTGFYCFERDKIFKTANQMDRHFAKLRDELVSQQTSAKKEQEQLQKRIDVLAKEKRELTAKVAILSKENKSTKRQVEEMVGEKLTINKRLECATKELKDQLKSKKDYLEKQEESLVTIKTLKTRIEQLTKDKDAVVKKHDTLESEYHNLLSNNNNETIVNNDYLNEEPEKDLTSGGDNNANFSNVDDVDYENLSQSDMDIQKVQMKLISLEQSLEKLSIKESPNFNNWHQMTKRKSEMSRDSKETASTNESNEEENYRNQLESASENCNNYQTIFDDHSGENNNGQLILHEDNKKMLKQSALEVNECVDNLLEIEKEINKNLLNIRNEYADLNDSSKKEYGDFRQWELRKGMVSNSPEFQKFMMKILEHDIL